MAETPKSTQDQTAPNDIVAALQKKAAFIQHSLPGLQAGKYEITVQQSLDTHPSSKTAGAKGAAGSELPGDFAPETKYFGVMGPRYSLDAALIHSVFPPAQSADEYSNALSHVVLEDEKLPWIRSPFTPDNELPPAENVYVEDGETLIYDDDVATWLAVLVLSPADLDGADPKSRIKTGTAIDLIPDDHTARNGEAPLKGALDHTKGYSQFSYFLEPQYAGGTGPIDPGVGHSATEPCKYIDLPAALFDGLAPSLADLSMMAHVREVVMTDKPIAAHQKVKPLESYSLVLGNRLPESFAKPAPGATSKTPPKGQNLAVLVSLENMEFALKGKRHDTSYYATRIATAPDGFVRLVVLHSWSFTSWFDTAFQFENLMKGLNGRPVAAKPDVVVPQPLLRLPDPPSFGAGATDAQQIAETMLRSGYVPMNHLTRVPGPEDAKGGATPVQTVSWYRGPLVPFAKPDSVLGDVLDRAQASSRPLVYSADKLLRFDPNVGMYDASYAAAWQLGRLLAIADKSFSVPLYRWKKTVEAAYARLLEDQVLADRHADLLALYEEVLGAEKSAAQLYKSVLKHVTKIAPGDADAP